MPRFAVHPSDAEPGIYTSVDDWMDSAIHDRDLLDAGVVLTSERLVDTWSHNRVVQVDAMLAQRDKDRQAKKLDFMMRQSSRMQHAKFFGLAYGSEEELRAWERTKAYRRSHR